VFDTAIKTNMEKYAMCLLEKKTGHKHPYQSDMQDWAVVPWQTYPCHVSCHRLIPVKASSTVYFPLSTRKSLMGIPRKSEPDFSRRTFFNGSEVRA